MVRSHVRVGSATHLGDFFGGSSALTFSFCSASMCAYASSSEEANAAYTSIAACRDGPFR